jgi:hypothetical protein
VDPCIFSHVEAEYLLTDDPEAKDRVFGVIDYHRVVPNTPEFSSQIVDEIAELRLLANVPGFARFRFRALHPTNASSAGDALGCQNPSSEWPKVRDF